MKSLFQFASKNGALSFFLGVEFLCLAVGVVFAIQHQFSKHFGHDASYEATTLLVLTEGAFSEQIRTELDAYTAYNPGHFILKTTSRAEALSAFANQKDAMLILSNPVTETELKQLDLNRERIPLQQTPVAESLAHFNAQLYLIQGHNLTKSEKMIANFFSDSKKQDQVFQKLPMHSIKSKNG